MQTHGSMLASASPEFYDRYMGPAQIEVYARDLAKRLDLKSGALLETAAGTGILTRILATTLPDAVTITATDLNQPRIAYAAVQPGTARVTWRQADALALPFGDGAFDLVICQFGVMFFPDKTAAYRETLRVLRPGGRFVFNVWDRVEENDFPRIVSEALSVLFPDDPPRFLSDMACGYNDADIIRDQLRTAGFGSIAIEPVEATSRFESADRKSVV